MDGRISRRGRWAAIGVIAGLAVVGFVGTAARLVRSMTSPAAVGAIGKPGQLMVIKTHPFLPALVVGTRTAKGGLTALMIELKY